MEINIQLRGTLLVDKMARKCCIPDCKTNYIRKKSSSDLAKKIPVYRFPKDVEEFERWRKSMPLKEIVINKNTVICEQHWPSIYSKVTTRGKTRPKNPPTVWPGVPASMIPTPLPQPRTTSRSSFVLRNQQPDQMDEFLKLDRVEFNDVAERVLKLNSNFSSPTTAYMSDDLLIIQSTILLNGVPNFIIRINPNMTYEAYHQGARSFIPGLSKNHILKIKSWSALEEMVRHLSSCGEDNKKRVIHEHLSSMSKTVGEKVYGPEMVIRAFEYFATSRALYVRLRRDYQLPAVSTISRITSKVSKIADLPFLKQVFGTTTDEQKFCVLLHDEVYVKKMLLYHGGTVFGKAENNPSLLAETTLGIMIICLHGGPKFINKIIPVSKLNANYLHSQVDSSQNNIQQAGGKVKAIICDGNRTNQAFFKKYDTVPDQPWVTVDGTFLLYDFVHLIKNIRNLWLTETMGELIFDDEGTLRTAKWKVLRELFELESSSLVKMSCLTKISVYPKPIERQRVQTCLKVFCDRTAEAILHHPELDVNQDVKDTAIFIRKVTAWWKILNVKQKGVDVWNREPLQAVISSTDDDRLIFIEKFGSMCLQMAGKQGKRVKQLSRDTAVSIYSTCKGLVALTKDLLNNCNYEYVLLGKFTTDPLEKEFGKLRQGSGATYFINVQQITEKIRIGRASLILSTGGLENVEVASGHLCNKCDFSMDQNSSEVFDNLPQLEDTIPDDAKFSLVYIAGYVVRKQETTVNPEDTRSYYERYGTYTDALNRGGLTIPGDSACQWVFFCYILFQFIQDNICQVSLTNVYSKISEFYGFEMSKKQCRTLANIFIKNFCLSKTPASQKETGQKILKLSK